MSKLAAALASLALAAVAGTALAQTQTPPPAASAPAASAPAAARPTIASPIKDLIANAQTRAVLEKHLPGVSQHPALPQFQDMTLAQVAPVSGGVVTPQVIAAIDADLKALPAA
jgi:hypothetical protein